MQNDFEERIAHNPMVGAVLLWEFTNRFLAENVDGPPLPLMFLPLPILFDGPSVCSLRRMNFKTGLARFIARCPTTRADLQRRTGLFAPTTWASINLACSSGLLHRAGTAEEIRFVPATTSLPKKVDLKGDAADLARAAQRLGAFLGAMTVIQIESALEVVI